MSEGRAEREAVPLEAHAEWAAPDDRPDPVGVLEEQNATRVPELVPIRHGRMIVSPFTFYRGGAAIMAWDLVAHADDGAARAVLRGRAPVELRRVRGAGPAARLRSQRLRRDAAGAVRVGRQAPGRELRRRGPRQRAPSQGAARGRARGRRGLSDDDGHGGDDALPRRLVRARSTSTSCSRELAATADKATRQGRAEEPREGAQATSLGSLGEVRRAGRRRLPDQAAAAGHRAPARDRCTTRPSSSSARD